MTNRPPITHVGHKLLLVTLLLAALGTPFVIAGVKGNLSHDTLSAGNGVLHTSHLPASASSRQAYVGPTVTSAAGQSILGNGIN
jgi:hypothetical protein